MFEVSPPTHEILPDHGLTQPLSYEHHNIEEPAILLGGSFVVDIAK